MLHYQLSLLQLPYLLFSFVLASFSEMQAYLIQVTLRLFSLVLLIPFCRPFEAYFKQASPRLNLELIWILSLLPTSEGRVTHFQTSSAMPLGLFSWGLAF